MGLMLEQLVRTRAFTNFLSQICGTGTDCLHRGKNTSDTFDFGNYSAFIWMNMELLTPTAASQHSCRSMWPVSASGCGTQRCIISFYKPIIRLSETPLTDQLNHLLFCHSAVLFWWLKLFQVASYICSLLAFWFQAANSWVVCGCWLFQQTCSYATKRVI